MAKLSPEAQLAVKTPPARRTTEQSNQIQETSALLEVTEKEIRDAMSQEERSRHQILKDRLAKFPKTPPLPMTLALQHPKQPTNETRILIRGDYNHPGDAVDPGFPSVLSGRVSPGQPSSSAALEASLSPTAAGGPTGHVGIAGPRARKNHVALADWMASPTNPLTARVMVNRLWQHHFGRGIVPTPSDFGTHGERPSHPELLDWLAGEFVARGWSLKKMRKLMLLSAVYQQSSRRKGKAPVASFSEKRSVERAVPGLVQPECVCLCGVTFLAIISRTICYADEASFFAAFAGHHVIKIDPFFAFFLKWGVTTPMVCSPMPPAPGCQRWPLALRKPESSAHVLPLSIVLNIAASSAPA